MKTMKLFLMMIGVALATLPFQSCLDDDGYSLGDFWIAIATVESDSGNASHYFRLDNGTTLWPADGYYVGHNLDDGQRVILNYTILSGYLKNFDHFIKVNDIDVVLTKEIAEDKVEKNDSIYGTDPVEVKQMWVGNGYLTVYFRTQYSGQKKHFINLVRNDREETTDGSIYLEFRHNAHDDSPSFSSTGPVSFDLTSLKATEKPIKLTIAVQTYDGLKTYPMVYDPDKPYVTTTSSPSDSSSGSANNMN